MLRLDNLGIAIDPPGGNFPFGKLKNSNPLGSGNGSPAVAEWANDPIQMIYAALDHYGITISDVAEQVGDSDFVRILEAVLPVGMMLPAAFTTDPATLNVRLLPCEGQTVSETTYAALFARIGTAFNTGGEPGGSFRLPETRGEGIRGYDNGRGIDTGRVFGSYQLDQFQGHRFAASGFDLADVADLRGTVAAFFARFAAGGTAAAIGTDGVNGVPRFGAETRMRNVTARFLIRY
jgi:microcystin-dependent protein